MMETKEEIWKPVKGYEGFYEVSNFGRVKSLEREVPNYPSGVRYNSEQFIKPAFDRKGYIRIRLTINAKTKSFRAHRLVAEAFIPNPNNLAQVNHKDENKQNNYVDNLEWMSLIDNIQYSAKRVIQTTLSGEFVKEWQSTMDCHRNGFQFSAVCRCCAGKKPQYKGFKWYYK